MRCFHPVSAFKLSSGTVVFGGPQAQAGDPFSLPCGQCVGCRLERSRQWAVRMMHEAQLNDLNCMVTLTYDNEHLPENGSLRYQDVQLFWKRLRKHVVGSSQSQISYFVAGEYGENMPLRFCRNVGRPHYHAIIFNLDFADKVRYQKSKAGEFWLYESATLNKLWPLGRALVNDVSFESVAYVARYVVDKINGNEADYLGWYSSMDCETGEIVELEPEFARMSLNPAIGKRWLEKFESEVARDGTVVMNGREMKAPKYYDKKLDEKLQRYEDVRYRRLVKARLTASENTDERLRVQEVVAKARLSLSKRNK